MSEAHRTLKTDIENPFLGGGEVMEIDTIESYIAAAACSVHILGEKSNNKFYVCLATQV